MATGHPLPSDPPIDRETPAGHVGMHAHPPPGSGEIAPDPALPTDPTEGRGRAKGHSQPVPYAWVAILTRSANARLSLCGTVRQLDAPSMTMGISSIPIGGPSASTGSALADATTRTTLSDTSAQAAGPLNTGPNNVLSRSLHNLLIRRNAALTPYIPDHWHSELLASGLLARYPMIPSSLVYGFEAGIPRILQTFAPPNHPSLTLLTTPIPYPSIFDVVD